MAIELKDLGGKIDVLAKGLGIDTANTGLLVELLQNKRITKPEQKFKSGTTKLKVAGKQPFVYVKEEKGSFMFLGLDFPMMKKHVEPKLKAVKKALEKAKEAEKESLEVQVAFFTALFDRVKKKKLVATSGKMMLKEIDKSTNECFMSLEGKVEGDDKGVLGDIFLATDYAAKNGEILRMYNPGTSSSSSDMSSNKEDKTEEDKGDNKEDKDTANLAANKQKRSGQMTKMEEGIGKMNQAKDSLPKDKMDANIAKYQAALDKLIAEAKKDGVIDADEQAQIDSLQKALNDLKDAVASNTGKKITPEQRVKIKENIGKINARLEAMVKALKL